MEEKSRSNPGLLNLILELLLNKSQAKNETSVLAMPSLGAHESRINQLKELNILLWRNSVSFNSEKFDYSLNDQKMLFTCGNYFLTLSEKLQLEEQLNLCDEKERNLFSEFKKIFREFIDEPKTEHKSFRQGKAWALLGCVQTYLFTSLGYVDPLYKVERKLQYVQEDVEDLKCTFYVKLLESRIFGSKEIETGSHFRFNEIEPTINNILTEREALLSKKAYRPANTDFLDLVKDFETFRNTVGSFKDVQNHVSELSKVFENLKNNKNPDIRTAERVVLKSETWQESLEKFIDRVESRFLPSYPDLVLPAFAALSDMKHGINMMTNHIQLLISTILTNYQDTAVEDLIEKMVSFPTIYPQQSSLLDLVNICTLDSTRELINKNLKTDNIIDSFKEQLNITLSGLHELHNHILLNGALSKSLWMKLSGIMQQIILIWKQQQKEIVKREIEENSMYKNRAQIHGSQSTEEEEIKLELENLFPTYREKDFSDFGIDAQRHEDIVETRTIVKERSSILLSVNDIKEVNRLYSNILISCTASNWMKPSSQSKIPDYINPLLMRCNTVGLLLDNVTASLSSKLSQQLYSSLNCLTHTTLLISQGKKLLNQQNSFDFYKDSNISEVTSCLSLMRNIFDKISLLLNEWPEHPTLRAIRIVIQRILEFPVTSSVSRFLTGLELLLVKMKEWEENAHKGVSLFEHMSLLTQQIISWRKLELSCWKDCLNVTFQRLQSQSSKWCFWLYILLESYINKTDIQDEADYFEDQPDVLKKNEQLSPETFAEALHCFVSKSPLVEFEARLELLLTFHCHAFYFVSGPERDEVLSITWNVYNYYKQFIDKVNTKINSIRNPIEKKLKDFVKITRWNDISYWAVKETIAKSHKTLHKFIKEYEKGLKENVTSCLLVNSPNNLMIDKSVLRREKLVLNSDCFILPPESIEKLDVRCTKHQVVLRPDDLQRIANKLKNKMISSNYSEIRVHLEDLVEDYMERSANLKKIEIDSTLPKQKQISHAKSILQQKKKALSDYFKMIAHLGISYRVGILAWKNKKDTVIELMIPPVDLNAALRNFDLEADKSMLEQWNGCENYYQKAVAEFIALTQMLSNAHKDLDSLNVERFKGYSAHLLLIANEQKRTLVEEMKHFSALRSQLSSLTKIKEDNNSCLPKQQDLIEIAKSLKELLIILQPSLDQLQLCLNACPSKSDFEENEVYDLEQNVLPLLNATKEDSLSENIKSVIEDSSHFVRTTSSQFNLIFYSVDNCFEKEYNLDECVPIFTMDHFNYLKNSYESLGNLKTKMTEIEKVFGAEQNLNHPLSRSVKYVNERISTGLQKWNALQNKTSVQYRKQVSDSSEFEKVLADVLRVVLNTFPIEETIMPETVNSSVVDLTDQLNKNIFNEMLIKSLKCKITEMNLKDVSRNFNKLLLMIHDLDTEHATSHFQMIEKCLPLLEQYLLYTQFYLTEQVASFRLTCKMLHLQLNVFLDLATNGFCIPKNLEFDVDNNAEDSQETTGKGGMGLSNEEGVQDVSDRIESEDQLEEAKSKDQEEQDMDNKSCPEEANGIDMSEDFEGQLQDIEKGEDDHENSDEDDGDLDKEMGETNEEANQQDKEIWGEDEKEKGDEDQNDTKEDGNAGKGEELDDKTIGAKNNDEALSKESREDQEKEEISEMNETDINDDQIDPYHGNQQPEVEPETFDLPNDINLDNEDEGADQENQEEDLFDIDNMKEPIPSPDDKAKDEDNEDKEDNTENNEEDEVESNADNEDDLPSDKNIEACPMESDVGAAEDSEVANEENDSEEQQTVPNADDPDKNVDNAMQIDVGMEGSQNNANQESTKEKTSENENIQNSQNDYGTGKSHQGLGRTETSLDQNGAQTDKENNVESRSKKRKSPKEMENRNTSLMKENEPMLKKTKTNIQERQNELEDLNDNGKELDDEMANKETEFRHVDKNESYNRHAIDAATEDQVKEQASKITMDTESEEPEEPMDINMLLEDELIEEETPSADRIQNPEQVSESEDKSKGKFSTSNKETERMEVDSDLQIVETTTVERGADSAFYTNLANLSLENVLNSKEFEQTRTEVKQVLAHWNAEPTTEEAITTWNAVSSITDSAARELAEKLRLVLEPTHASRLKGDYKTGKRINMRKIIPYIASQFRKDKIWLRRTKPSKRNYQIVLAIDDSSSMKDNDSKEMAYESLSLISKAMTYLEAGQIGVISFGENTTVLHPLGEAFTQESGARLMQKMRFEQEKTNVPDLVEDSINMFNMQNDSVENAKLLVILSDGRGVFSKGKNTMNKAVRKAKLAGVFTIFIVIDNPNNQHSILDITTPTVRPGKPIAMEPYMEHFPFPFYMILRDINALPDILSDALRQWFELIGNMDH